MFSVSSPRFANRLYLQTPKTNLPLPGFINCRRFRMLVRSVTENGKTPLTLGGGKRSSKKPSDYFKDLVEHSDNSCVADCLLPCRHPHCHFISNPRLITVCGENQFPPNIPLVPYVRQLKIGAGPCIQAATWIANAVLEDLACRHFGPAEISAWCAREELIISFESLLPRHCFEYFAFVGLTAEPQKAPITWERRLHDSDFRRTLISYLDSGMPVLLPTTASWWARQVDAALGIHGTASYHQQLLKPFDNHVVTIVGYKTKAETDGDHRFLVHDSASLPFIDRKGNDLARSFYYAVSGERDSGTIWPIVPKAVQLPLIRATSNNSLGTLGLIEVSRQLHSLASTERRFPVGFGLPETSRFVLLNLETIQQSRGYDRTALAIGRLVAYLNLPSTDGSAILKTALSQCAAYISRNVEPVGSVCWVWLEATDDQIWVWNAHRRSPSVRSNRGTFRFLFVGRIHYEPGGGALTFSEAQWP